MRLTKWRGDLRPWSWWRNLPDLLDEMFSLDIEPWWRDDMGVNIYEEGNDLVVEMRMPGFNKKDIEVTVSEDSITVKAERKTEESKEDRNYFKREFSYASVYRTIPLPKPINTDKVKAKYEDGILIIRAPKQEAGETEGIRVKVE